MSLLDSITSKKSNLKATYTVITHIDGRKFLESNETLTQLESNAYGFVVDKKPDNIPAKVIDYVYLGSQDCCDIDVLKNFKITNVLSIGIGAPLKDPNVKYYYIECLDLPETNIKGCLLKCVDVINSCRMAKENILVHCNAGISRSASVVIGYLMLTLNYTYTEALEIVKTARPCIKPNPGFEKQLKKLST